MYFCLDSFTFVVYFTTAVKALREYIVNFGKLKPGKHEFGFTIDENFYKEFEYSLVKEGNVHLLLTLEKQSERFLMLDFEFDGYIKLECDRCLDEFEYPVHSKKKLYVKLAAEGEKDESDELIFLDEDAYEIDLSSIIYEFINLELPLHKACEDGGKECNPDMMSYLGHVNDEQEDEPDPRWSGLSKLRGEEE